MPPGVAPLLPGSGPGWDRLAAGLRDVLPREEVDGAWAFRVLRSGGREYGTAIVSRVQGDRRRIYTARYALTVKGRERGTFSWALEEVGSGPVEALDELLALVPRRGIEEDPPVPVPTDRWFLEADHADDP